MVFKREGFHLNGGGGRLISKGMKSVWVVMRGRQGGSLFQEFWQ